MLVSCGAEGSIAVTQRFFCEFRFRFRVSASNSVMPGGSSISLKLLSYQVLPFALSWVVYPGRTICTCSQQSQSSTKPEHAKWTQNGQKKFSFPKIHSKASFAFSVPWGSRRRLAKTIQSQLFQWLGHLSVCRQTSTARKRTDFLTMSHGVVESCGVMER